MVDVNLVKKAENNDVEAMLKLARMYYDREEGYENEYEAFRLYQKVLEIDSNNARAINGLGNCYNNGFGVEKNEDKAIQLYRTAADMDYVNAQYNLADYLRMKGDPECLVWYQKAYENGDIDAPYYIAIVYDDGDIVPQDGIKAVEYYNRAIEIGNINAMVDLACVYLRGEIVEQNKEKAFELTQRAADAGNVSAINNMSLFYRKGDGVEANSFKAIEWARKALELGEPGQLGRCAIAYLDGEEPFEKDEKKGVEYLQLASGAGNVDSMVDLARCYVRGEGVDKDITEAIKWYEKACENDDEIALLELSDIYLKGEEVQRDSLKGIKMLQKAVDMQSKVAMQRLGMLYYYGDYGVEQDKEMTIAYWRMGSNAGSHICTRNLGICYKNGDGVSQNYDMAMQYFEKAVSQGSMDALIDLGVAYDIDGIAEQNYEKAVMYYKDAYDKGSVEGAYFLAHMYENGKGVEKNLTKAFELYSYASDNGDAKATLRLGVLYCDGLGVTKDAVKAMEYFEKAKEMGHSDADGMISWMYANKSVSEGIDPQKKFLRNEENANAGDADAQYSLHLAYRNGEGVEKDEKKAQEWLRKASDNGNCIAQGVMGFDEIFINGNTKAGVEYWEKASAGGNLKVTHDLAEIYMDGMGDVPVNKARAIELLKKAAEAGYAASQLSLGVCYANANYVAKDDYEAVKWFQKAAEQGDNIAQLNLAICYRNGRGCNMDKATAVKWFQKAAEQGNVQAKSCLADMYADGEGVIINYYKAEELYKEAIESGDEEFLSENVFNLAHLYATKMNDNYKAFPLWKRASELGITVAKYNLGLCYYHGWGTVKDNNQALYWWRQAAAEGDENARKNAQLLEQEMQNINSYNQNSNQNYNNNYGGSYQSSTSQKSGGCYVATAVYGSYDCSEVWILRRYRDYVLAESWYGRAFIKAYYAISPTIVKWFGHTVWFRDLWRGVLDRMVKKLKSDGVEDTPYTDKQF